MSEEQRLADLRELQLFGTTPEERFDCIVRTAARLFRLPIAFVGLVGEEQVWLKARHGLPMQELPRRGTPCSALVDGFHEDILVVEDMREDPGFASLGLVAGTPFVRFFAACPLFGPNHQRVGVLGVMGLQPRAFDEEEQQGLRDLAAWANRELQLSGATDDSESAPDEGVSKEISPISINRHAIIDSEARMRAVLNNASDGILTLDMMGVIESCNPAAEAIFGRRVQDMVGVNITSMLELGASSRPTGPLPSGSLPSLSISAMIDGEVTGRRGDGTTFPMEISLSEMYLGQRRMFTAIARDITERKRVDAMKEEFISLVSHELRTPLTSICGSLGLLGGGVLGEMNEKSQAIVDIAYQNSRRLVRLINDILDIEKIESGKMEFNFSHVSLGTLLAETIQSNEAYATQYQTRFVLHEVPPEARVSVDQDRLIQVFTNLLSNAAKFSAAGDEIQIQVEPRGQRYRVSVIDHGVGVSEAFRERMFEKFAQADSSSTRHKGGTGLGLSICKELIEYMGGEIGHEPTPGGGATFFFELPALL